MKYIIQANPVTTTRPRNEAAESEVRRMFHDNAVQADKETTCVYVKPGMEADAVRLIDQVYEASPNAESVMSSGIVDASLTWPKVKELLRIAFYCPSANQQFNFLDVQVATGRVDDRSCAPATPGGYWDIFHIPTRKTARVSSWLIAHTIERMIADHPVAFESIRGQAPSTTTASMFLSYLVLGYYDE